MNVLSMRKVCSIVVLVWMCLSAHATMAQTATSRIVSAANSFLSTLAIALLFMLSISAARAGDIKIGFIDMARVLRESAPALAAQKKLEKEFAPSDLALQRMAQQLENLRTSPGKNSAMVSGAENRKEGQDILTLDRDLQRARQTFKEDLARRRNEELAGVIGRVNRAAKVIAEAEGLDAIFQEAVFANPRIDVTDRVLKTLLLGADE